jgi:uncharacterized lipoprotein YddW (UPF0748 family)
VLNGWADYFTPQLYWPIDRPDLSYPVLLQWWVEQNAKGRHIWPGNYVDKVTGTPSGWLAEEMLNQIALTRAQPGATGNVYFSMRTLMGNGDNLPQKLMAGPYASKTLVPASPWQADMAMVDSHAGRERLDYRCCAGPATVLLAAAACGRCVRGCRERIRGGPHWK